MEVELVKNGIHWSKMHDLHTHIIGRYYKIIYIY